MKREIIPEETARAKAFILWMTAPNPMLTFFKTLDVTNLVEINRKKDLKFNMLMDYCIGKAASSIRKFYLLPVGDKLFRYDRLAVNLIVKNKTGEVNSCDLLFSEDLISFNREYLKYTDQTAENCLDLDTYKAFPSFMKAYLESGHNGIEHIITDERI